MCGAVLWCDVSVRRQRWNGEKLRVKVTSKRQVVCGLVLMGSTLTGLNRRLPHNIFSHSRTERKSRYRPCHATLLSHMKRLPACARALVLKAISTTVTQNLQLLSGTYETENRGYSVPQSTIPIPPISPTYVSDLFSLQKGVGHP